jgi:hypothetical protein
MITRPAYRLGHALSCVLSLAIAACGGSGDGDDDPPGDDTSGDPDARPGGTPDAPPAACATISGSWGISGSCGADLCTFTQAGCAITQVDCTSGAHSTSGSLTGNSFTYTGVSGDDIPATCDGVITGTSMAGTCNVAGLGTCDFSGTRN